MNNIHGPRGSEEEKKNKSEEKPDEHFVELSAVYIHLEEPVSMTSGGRSQGAMRRRRIRLKWRRRLFF